MCLITSGKIKCKKTRLQVVYCKHTAHTHSFLKIMIFRYRGQGLNRRQYFCYSKNLDLNTKESSLVFLDKKNILERECRIYKSQQVSPRSFTSFTNWNKGLSFQENAIAPNQEFWRINDPWCSLWEMVCNYPSSLCMWDKLSMNPMLIPKIPNRIKLQLLTEKTMCNKISTGFLPSPVYIPFLTDVSSPMFTSQINYTQEPWSQGLIWEEPKQRYLVM